MSVVLVQARICGQQFESKFPSYGGMEGIGGSQSGPILQAQGACRLKIFLHDLCLVHRSRVHNLEHFFN
jgi:hypothetical protein